MTVMTLYTSGFDVWLGNVRGNSYSNKHIFYPTESKLFWDFRYVEKIAAHVTLIQHIG